MKRNQARTCTANEMVALSTAEIIQNAIIGLTVSFVALSLGAALGILSGRGAFAGMMSAGLIALITSLLGGTRIQCSGPTAPMGALTATVVAYAFEHLPATLPGIVPDHFITVVLLLCAVLLMVMALLRLGKFIALVPNVVISGFMSGIALLIWVGQVQSLFGLGGKHPLGGSLPLNVLLAATTVALIFVLPGQLRRFLPGAARFLPATLVAILCLTLAANLLRLPVAHVTLSGHLSGLGDVGALLRSQWPSSWSGALLIAAFPFALQLAILCYLDTLLTSLIIDRMVGERTRQDKELAAQGLACSAVALVGGIPGAQATIRSVLLVKENATLRLAGVMVGIFVLVEMLLFQDLLGLIPQAVFAGVLFKVGYDVFDWRPLRLYVKELATYRSRLLVNFCDRHDEEPIFVSNREMLMILGTAVVTIVFDLNLAVGGFTVLFYLHNKLLFSGNPIRDLIPATETEALTGED